MLLVFALAAFAKDHSLQSGFQERDQVPTTISGGGSSFKYLMAGVVESTTSFFKNITSRFPRTAKPTQNINGREIRQKNLTSTFSPIVSVTPQGVKLKVSAKSDFREEALFSKEITVRGLLRGTEIDLGSGTITASNIAYGILAGDGMEVTGGQRPVISSAFWTRRGNLIVTKDPSLSLEAGGELRIGTTTESKLTFNGPALISFSSVSTTTILGNRSNSYVISTSPTSTPVFSINTKTPGGSVGIGTSSSAARFVIDNSSLISGTSTPAFLLLSSPVSTSTANIFEIRSSTSAPLFILNNQGRLGLGSFPAENSQLIVQGSSQFNGSSTFIGTSTFQGTLISSSNTYLATDQGKVGIGTQKPKDTLTIQGTLGVTGDSRFETSPLILTVTGCSGDSVLETDGSGRVACGSDEKGSSGSGGNIKGSGNSPSVAFFSGGNNLGGDGNFVFDNNRLGIGTSSPATTTSIGGALYLTQGLGVGIATGSPGVIETTGVINIRGTGTSTFANGIVLTGGCVLMPNGSCAGAGGAVANSGTASRLAYYSVAGEIDSANYLSTDTTNLFLGIGTTSPAQKLSVAGNLWLDSNYIYIGSSTAAAASTTIVYRGLATSTIQQNVNAWSIATSTTGLPIFSIDGSSGRGRVGIGTNNPGAGSSFFPSGLHVLVGGTPSSPPNGSDHSAIFENNASITTANSVVIASGRDAAASLYFGSGADGLSLAGIEYNISDSSRLSFRTNTVSDRMVIDSSGNVGIGTTSPAQRLSVSGNLWLDSNYITIGSSSQTVASTTIIFSKAATTTIPSATSFAWSMATTTANARDYPIFSISTNGGLATSTFRGGFVIANGTTGTTTNPGVGEFEYDPSSNQTTISNLTSGSQYFESDSGIVTWIDMPVSDGVATGTIESYTARINGTPLLTLYGLSAGSGFVATTTVGIGTTTPAWKLQINSATSTAGARAFLALSDNLAGTNLKHWTMSSQGGNFYVATSSDAYATSSVSALTINTNGFLGIGTSSPGQMLSTTGLLLVGGTGTSTVMDDFHVRDTLQIGTGSIFLNENISSFTGLLGLGSTSPAQRLSVAGNLWLDSNYIYVGSSTAASTTIAYQNSATSTIASNVFNAFSFATSTIQGSSSVFSIGTSGGLPRIGIGTSTPSALFAINGVAGPNLFSVGSSTETAFLIDNLGSVTVGTSSANSVPSQRDFKVFNGAICADNNGVVKCQTSPLTAGTVYGDASSFAASDVAENYPVSDLSIESGDIVMIDTSSTPATEEERRKDEEDLKQNQNESSSGFILQTLKSSVIKANIKNQDKTIGVISTQPGVLLGDTTGFTLNSEVKPVALVGRVPVKVSDESGQIKVGDPITISSVSGIGMKATTSGVTIGMALEPFDGSSSTTTAEVELLTGSSTSRTSVKTGKILVFLNLGYSKLDDALLVKSDFASGSPTSNAWSVDQVSGKVNVNFFGDLNLQGNSIHDVKKILGYLGKWSIDEDGTIIANKIITNEMVTERLEVKKVLKLGSPEFPAGITIYDEDTKEPYCIKVRGGAMISVSGECGSSSAPAEPAAPTEPGATAAAPVGPVSLPVAKPEPLIEPKKEELELQPEPEVQPGSKPPPAESATTTALNL